MTFDLDAALATDPGCVRRGNEDAAGIVRSPDGMGPPLRGTLAVVADGMGGHLAGEVASALAVETIRRTYFATPGSPGEALRDAIVAANRAIFGRAAGDRALTGMGTTVVALACCGGDAYAAHVGDSRLYLVRAGCAYQMTRDDSAVGTMVREGVLSRDEARLHEDRNVLLKAVGTRGDVDVTWWREPFPVHEDDVFVLCTDGLTDLVHDDEIRAAAAGGDLSANCRGLIDLAKRRGGFDNITVAMLRADARRSRVHAPDTRELRVTS